MHRAIRLGQCCDQWKCQRGPITSALSIGWFRQFMFAVATCLAINSPADVFSCDLELPNLSVADASSINGTTNSGRNRNMPRQPPKFRKFVGQKKKVDHLRRLLDGALARGEPFPHTMFVGPSGVGKTLLAEELAGEYGTGYTEVTGYISGEELAEKFTEQKTGDFVFFDECHNLKPTVQELLYQVIDDRKILCQKSAENEEDANGKEFRDVADCTIILATNLPGNLLDALTKRIPVTVRLGHYTKAELKEIVKQLATNINLLVSPHVASQIAAISLGIPRRAKHHLERLRYFFPQAESDQIGITKLNEYMRSAEMNQRGLERAHRTYLYVLYRDGSASLESLALRLATDKRHLRCEIEQPLVRLGLVTIGPKGRTLTKQGQAYVRRHRKQNVSME